MLLKITIAFFYEHRKTKFQNYIFSYVSFKTSELCTSPMCKKNEPTSITMHVNSKPLIHCLSKICNYRLLTKLNKNVKYRYAR